MKLDLFTYTALTLGAVVAAVQQHIEVYAAGIVTGAVAHILILGSIKWLTMKR